MRAPFTLARGEVQCGGRSPRKPGARRPEAKARMASPIAGAAEPRRDAASASSATRRGEPLRMDEPDPARSAAADDPQSLESVALAAPVRIGEQRRERRALPGRSEMTQRLEAGRAARPRRARPSRAAPQRESAWSRRQWPSASSKQGVGIDLLDPDRVAPARAGVWAQDKKERLFEKVDRLPFCRPPARSRSPPPSSAPSRMRASRRSVRSSTRWSGVRGSASIASGSANGSR